MSNERARRPVTDSRSTNCSDRARFANYSRRYDGSISSVRLNAGYSPNSRSSRWRKAW
jgi:hypothetical protein